MQYIRSNFFSKILILGVAIFLMACTPVQKSPEKVITALSAIGGEVIDLGTSEISEKNISKTIQLQNTTAKHIKILSVLTSCGCTKIQLEINGKSSPVFSQAGNFNWEASVAPYARISAKISYDSLFHGDSYFGPREQNILFFLADGSGKQINPLELLVKADIEPKK